MAGDWGEHASTFAPYTFRDSRYCLACTCTCTRRRHRRPPSYHTYHNQRKSLILGDDPDAASGPSTCGFCRQRPRISAQMHAERTLIKMRPPIGCEADRAGGCARAILHITATRPIVGCPIFRPLVGWVGVRSSTAGLPHFFPRYSTNRLQHGSWRGHKGDQTPPSSLSTTSLNFLPHSLAPDESRRSRRHKTQPRALRWA
jgi:hypothetical protein